MIKKLLLLDVAIILLLVLNVTGNDVCKANGAVNDPDTFCFQTYITLTNASSVDITDKPVRVQIDAAGRIAQGQLDARVWDFKPTVGSVANNADYMAQSVNSINAGFWFWIDSLPAGETRLVRVFHGNSTQRSDHGFFFNGWDNPIVVTDAAPLRMNGATDVLIRLTLDLFDDTPRDNVLIDKYDEGTSQGYRVGIEDISSANWLVFTVNDQTCSFPLNDSDERAQWDLSFIADAGADVFLTKNGISQTSCDTDVASISDTTGNDFVVGDAFDSDSPADDLVISHLDISNAGTVVIDYHFDANDVNETSAINGVFTGTIGDSGPNNYTGNYSFTEVQTGVEYIVGAPQLVSLSDFPTIENTNIVIDQVIGDSAVTKQVEVTNGMFQELIKDQLDDYSSTAGINSDGPIFALMMAIGFGLFIATGATIKFMPLSAVLMCTPPAIGAAAGWYEPYYAAILIIAVPLTWFGTTKAIETSVS